MRTAPSVPHFAKPVIGPRLARTRWLNAGYKRTKTERRGMSPNKKGAVAAAAAPFDYRSARPQFEFDGRISTRPIALTPLSAIAILWSRVTNI